MSLGFAVGLNTSGFGVRMSLSCAFSSLPVGLLTISVQSLLDIYVVLYPLPVWLLGLVLLVGE